MWSRILILPLFVALFLYLALNEVARADSWSAKSTFTDADIKQARALAAELRPFNRFTFADDHKVVSCEMFGLIEGEGFVCQFIFGTKTLVMTSVDMDAITERLRHYRDGEQARLQLGRWHFECDISEVPQFAFICQL